MEEGASHNLAAHDPVFAHQKMGHYAGLPGGIVEHLIGISTHPLPRIVSQIKALTGLELQILAVLWPKFLRPLQLLHQHRLGGDLPAPVG